MGYIRGQRKRQARQGSEDVERGRQTEEEYLRASGEFDAGEAAEESARAQFDTFREDLGEEVGDLRGSQVGRGRINTGFGFEEEDELVEGGLQDLMTSLSQNAMQSARLNLSNVQNRGRFGQATTERGMQGQASARDAAVDEEELRRQEEARRRSGLFGLAGRVGGTLLGPAGAAVGERLGEGLESLIS